ncbi:hypothetical protein COW36_03075 [bacterium (Candidatus Blackallbacteria) CG17_big_fil_post_rev_8_21_14_2_50_48_46]|uniref:Uncharacterized protein n=1 Tax=bacterium (Candidatus Blackallbacteria) CG17_big_fil_post_rev_8_21_14_2_50_48_46 TaxID=2014261 RepID=A0A2M7G9U6_9BACT|nr:MAG: hypothetical protein COW64_24485 [bacterium (Candidatus Blackallbacteria) CG18_big_fil_WC_8_21_14_2_50_49_26]PIW18876.1 MAG: hypothetical protein COW36_03075 [bacterium (Candidatus Blackallbacteria) CG17_big_fil_post_rev_8_21_14_2_50_48_46]PIW49966.1 MAG: hypothetical protein COW20_04085 [bacterium (Candidatus Blackallbacteria) CG13_big_fil_rev_8_21_14_2_50_49_14]
MKNPQKLSKSKPNPNNIKREIKALIVQLSRIFKAVSALKNHILNYSKNKQNKKNKYIYNFFELKKNINSYFFLIIK